MYRLIRNALDRDECFSLVEYTLKQYPCEMSPEGLPLPHKKLYDIVAEHYNLENCVLVEQWHNDPNYTFYPIEHIDKDEGLWREKEEVSLPICSAIVYILIKDLEGANLEISKDEIPLNPGKQPFFENIDTVVPEAGSVVLLDPGVWHKVSKYEKGRRVTLILNFWDKPLYNS